MGNPLKLNEYIDHTLLKPEATEADILKLCDEAKEFSFKTVCIEMKWLPTATKRLAGSKVLPITVLSFPHGNDSTSAKKAQAKEAVALGAKELDMVLNRDLIKAKKYTELYSDIFAVVEEAKGLPVKVILETSELTDGEKYIASAICKAAGASFVKTSTGFSKSGATVADVRLMRETVGPELGVKASGGIRSYEDAIKMIEAGATRLGTSASIAIVKGANAGGGSY